MLKFAYMLSSRQIFSILSIAGMTWGLPSFAQTNALPSPTPVPSVSPDLGNRIQAYFTNSRKELGNLEPWQVRLFNEEAVPEYQRFVRGYGLSNGSSSAINADIDFENLRNFLRFYAPKSLKREKPSIVAVLKPQSNCSKCVSGLAEVKALVANRLERRGFKVLWVSASELGEASLAGAELVAAAKQSAIQKDAVGSLVVYWQRSMDDEDAMHPDSRHYTIHSLLEIRDITSTQEQLELTETGSFEHAEGKLLADAFTELGAKLGDLELTQSEIKREETLVEVAGIQSFSQYQAIKNAFQGALKGGSLEDQKISRGRAVFVVYSDASPQKIQQAVSQAKVDGMQLGAAKIEANEIHLEVTAMQPAAGAKIPADAPANGGGSGNDSVKGDPEA